MYKNNKLKAYSAGVIFSIMVGFSFVGVKTCVPLASTLQILTHRYNFAMVAVVIVILCRIWSINILGKPKKKLFITAIFYILFMAFQTMGLYFSTSIESAILFAIIPVLVQFLSEIFLKEKINILQNIFIFMSVVALIYMIVISATNVAFSPLGTFLLLLSSLCMAINNVMMRYVRSTYTPFEITFVIVVLGFICFNITYISSSIYLGNINEYFEPFSHSEFIIATAYLGICCILFSALLMAYMQANMPAVNASMFGNVSTAISIIAGVVVLGENLKLYHIVCAIIIVASVIGLGLAGRRQNDGKIHFFSRK